MEISLIGHYRSSQYLSTISHHNIITPELPAVLRTALPTYPRKMRTNISAGPAGIGQGVMF